MLYKFFLVFFAFLLIPSPQSLIPSHAFSKPPVKAKNGMVVTSEEHASRIGLEVLKKGGNAVDAALAAGWALAVTLPTAGNIGGGGFMVIRLADGTATTVDFREKAPAAAHEAMYLDAEGRYVKPEDHDGYDRIGVPGTVAGFFLAHEKYGRLPMTDLITPAIRLAEEGIEVTWGLHAELTEFAEALARYPETARVFLKNGVPYEPGEVWRQPDLAATLGRIRDEGPDDFYKGKTAHLLAEAMRRHGGLITAEDLAAYRAVERPPVTGTYRGYEVLSMGPPSSGGTVLIEALNILEGFDPASGGFHSAAHVHLMAESMRRAFRDRAFYLGDPDFNPDLPLDRLISKDYAASLRAGIDPERAGQSTVPGDFRAAEESADTTHISVVDADGNAVSLTYTLEMPFGSKVTAEGTGFLLNNEMGDFNPDPGHTDETGLIGTAPNRIAPHKRMLSSMSPTLLTKDGRIFMVIGTPGGRTIINTVLQIIVNVVDFGMDVSEAVAAPRFHHQWLPDRITIEKFGLSPETITRLEGMGHAIEVRDRSRSQGERGAMGILIGPDGLLTACADPRTPDGLAAGY